MNILLVEDNDQMRTFMKSLLINWGHSVLEANNGRSAIEIAKLQKPDIILMDINLGKMDGIEVVLTIRENKVMSKIIMVTEYDNPNLRKNPKTAGADGYVLKENLLSLEEVIKNYI